MKQHLAYAAASPTILSHEEEAHPAAGAWASCLPQSSTQGLADISATLLNYRKDVTLCEVAVIVAR